jgi:hypothetical protein
MYYGYASSGQLCCAVSAQLIYYSTQMTIAAVAACGMYIQHCDCNSGVSSIALRMGGETWVFDAGEGTQIQIQRSPVKPTKISKVTIQQWASLWFCLS